MSEYALKNPSVPAFVVAALQPSIDNGKINPCHVWLYNHDGMLKMDHPVTNIGWLAFRRRLVDRIMIYKRGRRLYVIATGRPSILEDGQWVFACYITKSDWNQWRRNIEMPNATEHIMEIRKVGK